MDTTGPTTEQPQPPSVIQQVRGHAISGAIFGSVYKFLEGATNSPSGSRLSGGALAVRSNTLRIGSFAAWYGAAKSVRCAVAPDYPLETTVAWSVTDALFSVRHGLRAAGRSGLRGAVVGVVPDMLEYSLQRYLASRPRADDRCIPPE
uniref:Mitochondrial import inner membrane translocase subunit Tim17 n=1 Tax=Aegilops tauschii TaxID=37682 RepID=M8BYL7_AEGTA